MSSKSVMQSLRECMVPESDMLVCETPQQVVDYWRLQIASTPHFNSEDASACASVDVEHEAPREGASVPFHRHDGHRFGASA